MSRPAAAGVKAPRTDRRVNRRVALRRNYWNKIGKPRCTARRATRRRRSRNGTSTPGSARPSVRSPAARTPRRETRRVMVPPDLDALELVVTLEDAQVEAHRQTRSTMRRPCSARRSAVGLGVGPCAARHLMLRLRYARQVHGSPAAARQGAGLAGAAAGRPSIDGPCLSSSHATYFTAAPAAAVVSAPSTFHAPSSMKT